MAALLIVWVPLSYLSAQKVQNNMDLSGHDPVDRSEFLVQPATGALSWTLRVGTVPGDLPVPVVFRFQASMTGNPAQVPEGVGAGRPSMVYHGIWASLHFGFITPSRDDEEGTQVLEDGTVFRDRAWAYPAADGGHLPLAFGFKAPLRGYATERSRTYGLYDAASEDLGRWRSKVPSEMGQFKVLMDRDRARVYGFNSALGSFVPILWVDRFGHSVNFSWQQSKGAGGAAFTVRVTNEAGKGIQVAWAEAIPSAGEVDLLRADFIRMALPSMLVRGHAGASWRLPSALEPATAIPVPLAAGRPVGRPSEVRLGAPGSLPLAA